MPSRTSGDSRHRWLRCAGRVVRVGSDLPLVAVDETGAVTIGVLWIETQARLGNDAGPIAILGDDRHFSQVLRRLR